MFICVTRQWLCIQHACLQLHNIRQHVSLKASWSWHTVQLISVLWQRVINVLRCSNDNVDGVGSKPTSQGLGTWTRTFTKVSCTAWFCVVWFCVAVNAWFCVTVNEGTARGGGGDLLLSMVVLSRSWMFGSDENNMFRVEEHNAQE